MKRIKLTRNQFAIIDDSDYTEISMHKWFAHFNHGNFYAYRKSNNKTIPMHRIIIGAPDNMQVDHINGNGLDNRKSNLRLATKLQNSRNRKIQSNNKTGYKGVCSERGKWYAYISINGKKKRIGYFISKKDAARAYDKKSIEIYGEYAKTNFKR